jgi:hypothetical protein
MYELLHTLTNAICSWAFQEDAGIHLLEDAHKEKMKRYFLLFDGARESPKVGNCIKLAEKYTLKDPMQTEAADAVSRLQR